MGCFYHGCPTCFHPEERHPKRGETYGHCYQQTVANLNYLRQIGYSPVVEWECTWKEEQRNNPHIKAFLNSHFAGRENKGKLKTPLQLIDEVKRGNFFGAVEVFISVPDEKKWKFSQMTMSQNDIGNHIRKFAEEEGSMPRPRHALIRIYFGDKILLATPLLQFYLEQGLVVSSVSSDPVDPRPLFSPFRRLCFWCKTRLRSWGQRNRPRNGENRGKCRLRPIHYECSAT